MNSTDVCSSALQSGDEIEHLGLDGGVEAGRGLVEDQQGRIGRERHRDHDALLHAAGELVRVAAPSPSRDRRSGPARARNARRSVASLPLAPRTPNTSATCFPIRIDGFSAAPGFW